jgi:hypothetical protein
VWACSASDAPGRSQCTEGCAKWSDVANATKLFANASIPADAGSMCAMPGSSPVHGEGRRLLKTGDDTEDSWMWRLSKSAAENGSVPICICKGSMMPGFCTPPMSTPEQINLQYAAKDIVVAAFVTYEDGLPTAPPTASFGEEHGEMKTLSGISHWYVAPVVNTTGRNYTISFIKFENLKPATRYSYKVKSGAANGAWSDVFTFRSLSDKHTRVGMYGDMGVSEFNNMANLLNDCQSGKIDVFVHMGDHCYNMCGTLPHTVFVTFFHFLHPTWPTVCLYLATGAWRTMLKAMHT